MLINPMVIDGCVLIKLNATTKKKEKCARQLNF
jgi:hypothetical protein